MIEIIGMPSEDIVFVKASGMFTGEDLDGMHDELSELVVRHGKDLMLFQTDHFHGLETELVFQMDRFDFRYLQKVRRIAIVGEGLWEWWMTAVVNPLCCPDLRYFDRSRLEDAWFWLRTEGRAAGYDLRIEPAEMKRSMPAL